MTLRQRLGPRLARLATDAVVARPSLWRVFREPLRREFDRLADGWDDVHGPGPPATLEAALGRVETATRILDLGTGTGKAARVVAALYPEAEVLGVDLSPEMVRRAQALLPHGLAGRVRFVVGDAARLDVPSGGFDLVVLLNMIPFFDELARVTAPGGVLVLAFSVGPSTPIYVPPDKLEARLAPLGFGRFEQLEVAGGSAFLARRADG